MKGSDRIYAGACASGRRRKCGGISGKAAPGKHGPVNFAMARELSETAETGDASLEQETLQGCGPSSPGETYC